jgi:hypothetical protein
MPALAVVIAIALFTGDGFDAAAVRDALAAGDPDEALHLLATAPQDELPEAIRGLHWWTKGRRAESLARLATRPEPDLLEDAALPTLVAPLGIWLSPPDTARLREPAAGPLLLELRNVTLNLPVATLPFAPGGDALPLGVPLLPGTRYALFVRDGSGEGALVLAAADFTLASPADAGAIRRVVESARALGPQGHPGATLLAANAALECGCSAEALELLRGLQQDPAVAEELGRAARELEALALDAQGLDVTARSLLSPP